MAAIHTSPSQAVSEIDLLVDVYDDIVQRWNVNDVMILGDFNAGCSYVTKSAWKEIRLAKDRRFYWLFSDHVDTTVANSDCPYDRYINLITGHFRIAFCLCFNTRLRTKPLIWNEFDLHESEPVGGTHFHLIGFEIRLVFTQRQKAIRK